MKYSKRHYKPKLNPDRALAGATPETLALALLGKRCSYGLCPQVSRCEMPIPIRVEQCWI